METDLTKRIKTLTHYYKPLLNTKMRTIRWADEVWTPTGIVDSIRFEDYYENEEYLCRLIDYERFLESENKTTKLMYKLGECFRDKSAEKSERKCRGCVFKSHAWTIGMATTCYETKITYSDFKSKHGHNFHGNYNYYCVPKSLAPKIVDLIPEDIGILAYYEGNKQYGLREYKAAQWREMNDEVKIMLLYNAMKKWCDGAVFINEDMLKEG